MLPAGGAAGRGIIKLIPKPYDLARCVALSKCDAPFLLGGTFFKVQELLALLLGQGAGHPGLR
jgi:hypothetical protein